MFIANVKYLFASSRLFIHQYLILFYIDVTVYLYCLNKLDFKTPCAVEGSCEASRMF